MTGSRDWRDRDSVWSSLGDIAETMAEPIGALVVVHGDCVTGADRFASEWAASVGAVEEPHPADWVRWGKKAGPRRNREMVRSRIDVCLAFVRPCTSDRCDRLEVHGSHGATGCAEYARQRHIPTSMHYEGWSPLSATG